MEDGCIPIEVKNSKKEGCIAELSLSPEVWDEQGRLRGTVFVYEFDPAGSQYQETAYHDPQEFPIFYSILSPLELHQTHQFCVLFEFATTPFSKQNQRNFVGRDFHGDLVPVLELPQEHKFYEAKNNQEPYALRRESGPAPEEQHDDSTTSWIANMDPEERSDVKGNWDIDD